MRLYCLIKGQTRSASQGPEGRDYSQMHDLARHAIHSTETLHVAAGSISKLIEKHRTLTSHASLHSSDRVGQDLESLSSFVENLEGRSRALQLRLQNEINLVRIEHLASEVRLII